jgi:urea transport system permease protein
MLAGLGCALFVLQVGFMSPSIIGIVPSIEMVIFTAVGGRLSVIGAVLGCLIVNFGKTAFSEAYPDAWLYLMGGTFIAVVMFFPDGLAGILDKSKGVKEKLTALGGKAAGLIRGMKAKTTPATAGPAPAVTTDIPNRAD